MFQLLIAALVIALPVTAFAQAPGDDVGAAIKSIVEMAGSGAWGGAVGLGIMLLVSLASKLKLLTWVPAEGKRWVALGIAILGAIGAGLVGGAEWHSILGAAFTSALTAVGSWELIGKLASSKSDEAS